PLYVDGDPTRLQQIIVNLLHNAAKYTEAGRRVQLDARRADGDAVLRVVDAGAGIAPELLESIFELFVQSARTLDRAQGGIGVGLTMVRGLVAMHGGSVTARSEGVGRGSEFEVRLPIARGPEHPGTSDRLAAAALRRGATVVVVEDNEDARELLCELLVS